MITTYDDNDVQSRPWRTSVVYLVVYLYVLPVSDGSFFSIAYTVVTAGSGWTERGLTAGRKRKSGI